MARVVDEEHWASAWFSDYSVVSEFERDVNALELRLSENEDSKKRYTSITFTGWSAQYEEISSKNKIWKLASARSEGWSEGLEAPAKASDEEFGGSQMTERFFLSSSSREEALSLRNSLRSLFGCWDEGIVVEAISLDTAWLVSSSERIAKARTIALYWAGALRCACATEKGPIIALTKPAANNFFSRDWYMRGFWIRRGEPVIELVTKKVNNNTCNPDTALDVLASVLGTVSSFEMRSHTMITARYTWYTERRHEHIWGMDRKVQCDWRNKYCDQKYHAEWFHLTNRLRAGIDGDPHSGLRRGDPLWGPRIEPIRSYAIQVTWRKPMLVVDLPEDEEHSDEEPPFEAAEYCLTLRFFAPGEQSPTEKSQNICVADQNVEAFSDSDETSMPLASSLRSMFAFLALSSFSALPKALMDRDFIDQAMNISSDKLPPWLRARALKLVTRRGTLSEARLQAYLADLGPPTCSLDAQCDDESSVCGAERFSVLAIRLAGLSSLEAVVALWRAYVAMLRTEFEDALLVEQDDYLMEESALEQENDQQNDLSLQLIGKRRLTESAVAAFYDAARGCPLRRTVRLAEACAEALKCDEIIDEDILGLRQFSAPVSGSEALELERLYAVVPDEAAQRSERAGLKQLASEMAAFKSDLEIQGSQDPEEAFDIFVAEKEDVMMSSYDDLVWRQVWEAVIPTPAVQVSPHFNAADEAEHALHRLEVAHPVWVLAQLAASALSTAPFILATAHPVSSKIPSVRGAIDTAKAACRNAVLAIISKLTYHDVGPTTLSQEVFSVAAIAIDAVAAAELHLARAVALTSRVPSQYLGWNNLTDHTNDKIITLLENILRSAAGGKPLDLSTDSLPVAIALFSSFTSTHSTDLDENFSFSENHYSLTKHLPIPNQREYVLWAQTPSQAGRWDRETLFHRVYATGYRDNPDTTHFALALSIADDDEVFF